jgi:hypothetical protein
MRARVEFHLQSSPTGKEHDTKAAWDLSSQRTIFAVEGLTRDVADIRNLVSFNDRLDISAERVMSG